MASQKNTPNWSDVKAKLADFDRTGLIGLIQDLYAANKNNQVFLHARFALGSDVLKPYKASITRWLWPDVFKGQDTSVTKAKKAISDYKKAIGQSEGLAELMVFYCEQAAGFSHDVGLQDEAYFGALVRMFEQALVPRRRGGEGFRRVDRRRVQGAKRSDSWCYREHLQRRNRLRAAGRTLQLPCDGVLEAVAVLPNGQRPALYARLDKVRHTSHNFGYGVGDDMDDLLVAHGVDD